MTRAGTAVALLLLAVARSGAEGLEYADDLAARSEWKAAAEEVERQLVTSRAGGDESATLERAFRYGERAGDAAFVERLARRWERAAHDESLACLARWYRGRALYAMGDLPGALGLFSSPAGCSTGSAEDYRHYAGLALARSRRWNEARASFESAGALHREGSSARAAEAMLGAPRVPFRSPAVASALAAVFPGAGYAYDGSPGSAVAAFVTVGALSWAAWSSFRSRNGGAGGVAAALAFGWHLGGVYGAARAAHRRNDLLLDGFLGPFEY